MDLLHCGRRPARPLAMALAVVLAILAGPALADGSGNGNGNGFVGDGHGNGYGNGETASLCGSLAELLNRAARADPSKLSRFDCRDANSGRDNGRGNIGAFNGMLNGMGNRALPADGSKDEPGR